MEDAEELFREAMMGRGWGGLGLLLLLLLLLLVVPWACASDGSGGAATRWLWAGIGYFVAVASRFPDLGESWWLWVGVVGGLEEEEGVFPMVGGCPNTVREGDKMARETKRRESWEVAKLPDHASSFFFI